MIYKTCTECLKDLPVDGGHFHKNGNYLHGICKICRNAKNPVVPNDGTEKTCTVCNKSLLANLENFHYTKRSKDGLRSQCKPYEKGWEILIKDKGCHYAQLSFFLNKTALELLSPDKRRWLTSQLGIERLGMSISNVIIMGKTCQIKKL